MEKYKEIIRKVKETFPRATDVHLIITTNLDETTAFSADISEFIDKMDTAKGTSEEKRWSSKGLNGLAFTKDGGEIHFNGKIFVTTEKH